jgi:hypothetical protein
MKIEYTRFALALKEAMPLKRFAACKIDSKADNHAYRRIIMYQPTGK